MKVWFMHSIKSLADKCRCGLYRIKIHAIYYLKTQSDTQKIDYNDMEILFICY